MPLGRQRWTALAFLAVVLTVGVGVPLAGLARWLWFSQQAAIDWAGIWTATTYTLWVAALGALLTTALALPVGILAARSTSPVSRFTESAAYIGFALPGITVGLALVFFGIRLLPQWYQHTPMLVMGYAVLFLPLAVGSIRAAVASIPLGLEDASATLGSGRMRTGIRVMIPLAAPGVVAGGGTGVPHHREGTAGDVVARADRGGHPGVTDVEVHRDPRVRVGGPVRGDPGARRRAAVPGAGPVAARPGRCGKWR